jgi:hypothetical protein
MAIEIRKFKLIEYNKVPKRHKPKDVIVPENHKWCPECREVKPLNEFSGKKASYCKLCRNIYKRRYYARHIKRCRRQSLNQHLWRAYKLTPGQYEFLLNAQKGRCRICKIVLSEKKGLEKAYVDHSHLTKEVRSILCGACYMILGILKERPERVRDVLLGMVKYTMELGDRR